MTKVVINVCHGGFGLSKKAVMHMAKLKGVQLFPEETTSSLGLITYWLIPEGEEREELKRTSASFHDLSPEERKALNKRWKKLSWEINAFDRDDPEMVKTVEDLGAEANGMFANLKVIEIPDDVKWTIEEYDGYEHIAEEHRTWEA